MGGLWKGEYCLRCQESNYSANLKHWQNTGGFSWIDGFKFCSFTSSFGSTTFWSVFGARCIAHSEWYNGKHTRYGHMSWWSGKYQKRLNRICDISRASNLKLNKATCQTVEIIYVGGWLTSERISEGLSYVELKRLGEYWTCQNLKTGKGPELLWSRLIYVNKYLSNWRMCNLLKTSLHKVTAWTWMPGKKRIQRFWHQPKCFNVFIHWEN